jgi:hypothetical protein
MRDDSGPTSERLRHAGEFCSIVGRSRSSRRITMLDDALGRALVKKNIQPEEYSALKRYALHWLAGGLMGQLGSVDLNRIMVFDPGSMSGLAKSEAQSDHRRLYHAARERIGTRPALVADHVACFDTPLSDVGTILGYRSTYHGKVKAIEILSDAGYRLGQFWHEMAKRD